MYQSAIEWLVLKIINFVMKTFIENKKVQVFLLFVYSISVVELI